jgi:hypothetical protein
MFGSGDRLKTQAMEVLMETAAGLQTVTVSRPIYSDVRPPVTAGVSILDQMISMEAN